MPWHAGILGGEHQKLTKLEMAASPMPSKGPKKGVEKLPRVYIVSVPQQQKSKVKTCSPIPTISEAQQAVLDARPAQPRQDPAGKCLWWWYTR